MRRQQARPGHSWAAGAPRPPRTACCACVLLRCGEDKSFVRFLRTDCSLYWPLGRAGAVRQGRGVESQCPDDAAASRRRHVRNSAQGAPRPPAQPRGSAASAHLPRGGGQKLSSQIVRVPASLAKKNKTIRHQLPGCSLLTVSLAPVITHRAGRRLRGRPRTLLTAAGPEHDPEDPEGHLLEECPHTRGWGPPTSLLRPLGGAQRGTFGANLINCGMKYLSTYTSLRNLSLLEISIKFSFLMSLCKAAPSVLAVRGWGFLSQMQF